MQRLQRNSFLLGAVLALASCQQGHAQVETGSDKPGLALFGTLPIFWGEGDGPADFLGENARPGWVRAKLEKSFVLTPLDTVEAEALAGKQRLLMAQPRPLAPSENVALDDWVRSGGDVVIFADPMLTRETRFAVGDKRRPQDVILLSPILTRWGLELHFDEDQPQGARTIASGIGDLPVNLSGQFTLRPGEGDCMLDTTRTIARCAIGKGHAVLVADATLLDDVGPSEAPTQTLDRLLETAFPR